MLFLLVGIRPGAAVFQRELDREIDVQNHGQKKNCPDDPEEGPELTEMFGVAVDPIRPEKNLQVAQEMADYERDQDYAGDRDNEFFAD